MGMTQTSNKFRAANSGTVHTTDEQPITLGGQDVLPTTCSKRKIYGYVIAVTNDPVDCPKCLARS